MQHLTLRAPLIIIGLLVCFYGAPPQPQQPAAGASGFLVTVAGTQGLKNRGASLLIRWLPAGCAFIGNKSICTCLSCLCFHSFIPGLDIFKQIKDSYKMLSMSNLKTTFGGIHWKFSHSFFLLHQNMNYLICQRNISTTTEWILNINHHKFHKMCVFYYKIEDLVLKSHIFLVDLKSRDMWH